MDLRGAAAVALGWLYRRRFAPAAVREATPRRLVFCLPMRTIVSQAQEASTPTNRLSVEVTVRFPGRAIGAH
jgi:hypothetical protein